MSVVVINALHVPENQREGLERNFVTRKQAIVGSDGLEDFRLLRPAVGDDRYFVMSRWASREQFDTWVRGASHHARHDDNETGDLLIFEVVDTDG
ncbi:MAG: antibiotic biosynthesis monooxygenase [Gordonia sp. (in: high G+C Gram-positive bacteria)]